MPNPFLKKIKLRQLIIIIILAQYLIFADVVVGLVFKPLLDTSERDVPVIFGNILTETEDRQGGGSRGKKQNLSMIQFTCSNTSIISWGQILLLVHLRITVC